jgi:hypothetical protein
VSDFLAANAAVTRSELVAILGLPAELVDEFIGTRPSTLREALRAAVLIELAMLDPATAVFIATQAAIEAEAGGRRILNVTWLEGVPSGAWVSEVGELSRTGVHVLAETMFTTLAARLVAHRAAMVRPN